MSDSASPSSPKRILLSLLLIAGVAIVAACFYKTTKRYQPVDIERLRPTAKKNAPSFELLNHHKPQEVVRLATYLGRHRILLVFFDSQTGVMNDHIVTQLLEMLPELKSTDTKVIVISNALPQENRKMISKYQKTSPQFRFPFPLLTDVDGKVLQAYGRYDEQTKKLLPGLIVIDRKGQIPWTQSGPKTASTAPEALRKLVNTPQ